VRRFWNITISALFAAITISGCNSGPMESAQTGCTETLSGAVAATYGCSTASGAWDAASNTANVSLATVDSSSNPYALTVRIPFGGEPQIGPYTIADHGTALGGVSLQQGTWFAGAVFVPSGHLSIVGNYTLMLTSVSVVTTASTGKTYAVHGTLDANLIQVCAEPPGVVCPPVTLRAVF
jgi:hypothetical protein